jgi:hypothetical protein
VKRHLYTSTNHCLLYTNRPLTYPTVDTLQVPCSKIKGALIAQLQSHREALFADRDAAAAAAAVANSSNSSNNNSLAGIGTDGSITSNSYSNSSNSVGGTGPVVEVGESPTVSGK